MFANIIRSWNEMSTYRKVRRIFMIGLLLFGLWALTPYLYNRQVDEAFPAAAPAMQEPAQPTAMAGQAMQEPTAMQESAMQKPTAMAGQAMQEPTAMAAMPAAPAMQEPAQPTAMAAAPAGPVALHAGSLIPGSFPGDRAEGNVTIYRLEDGKQVLRLEDFKTTNGPDLFVVLSAHANPDKDDVKSADYTQLAALKGNQGNQNYELPTDIDLGKYQSVVIWCRTFNIVFGYATLQPAAS